jgi:hypothetical protein
MQGEGTAPDEAASMGRCGLKEVGAGDVGGFECEGHGERLEAPPCRGNNKTERLEVGSNAWGLAVVRERRCGALMDGPADGSS